MLCSEPVGILEPLSSHDRRDHFLFGVDVPEDLKTMPRSKNKREFVPDTEEEAGLDAASRPPRWIVTKRVSLFLV